MLVSELYVALAMLETAARIDASDAGAVRAARYARPEDAARSRAAWTLAQSVVAGLIGPELASTLRYGSRDDALGRPLVEGKPGVDVNVTHAASWVAAAASRMGRIGIDLEMERSVEHALVDRCCTPFERGWIDAAPSVERPGRFFRLWTLKEAYLKATGIGLRAHPREIPLVVSPVSAHLDSAFPDAERWRFRSWHPVPELWLSICFESASAPDAELHLVT
jgi:4'-phosphopantetheinyl transferase